MIDGLYQALAARAECRCENPDCRRSIPPASADHFFGRARADEVEFTVWLLCKDCDYAKTRNSPDASTWLRRFIEHCKRYGYVDSQQRAEARLVFVDTRRELGARL